MIASLRSLAGLVLTLVALALAACTTGTNLQPAQPNQPMPGVVTGGAVKVGLLLPLGAAGEPARIATAMKQAAEQALLDAGGSANITLITKDTGGTADGARAAAVSALNEGAELILGPLLAPEVAAAAPVAKAKAVPVIAFSSQSSTAQPGVYLMSFLPEEEVANLIRYATSTGIRSFGAMTPQSQYGQIFERALTASAQASGATVATIERYDRSGDVTPVAQKVAAAVTGGQVQGLFLPEGGQKLRQVATALQAAGLTAQSARMMGTGLWDDPVTWQTPLLEGGWYAGVAPDLVARFDQQYRSTYGGSPPRLASLAYDAVNLAVQLAKYPAGQRFTDARITTPEGFNGVNGLYRFRSNGRIERSLSILEVTSGGPRVLAPAPQKFSAGY
ncbi:MAG: penicillin-binding protein activator [Hyphomicrobiales bacterium]